MMKIYLLGFFCLFLLNDVFAQLNFREGYIITTQHDTIRGMVRYSGEKLNTLSCFFKKSPSQDSTEFFPTDIMGYGFEGDRRYLRKRIIYNDSEDFYFLEQVVNGRVSLYEFTSQIRKPIFYVEKEGVLPLTELRIDMMHVGSNTYKRRTYVETLSFALKEVGFPRSKIENTRLDRRALARLIIEYNLKTNPVNVSQANVQPKKNKIARANFGFILGINQANLVHKEAPDIIVEKKLSTLPFGSISLFANIDFFFWQKSFFSLQPEITYVNSQVDVLFRYSDNEFVLRQQLDYLKLPFNIRLDFVENQEKKIFPYLTTGILYAFPLADVSRTIDERMNYSPDRFYKIQDEEARLGLGTAVSFGTDFKINSSRRALVELRLETLQRSFMQTYFGVLHKDGDRAKIPYDGNIFSRLDKHKPKLRVNTISLRLGYYF